MAPFGRWLVGLAAVGAGALFWSRRRDAREADDDSGSSMSSSDIVALVVHYSGATFPHTADDVVEWHTADEPAGNGWSEVGYHYIVDSDGELVDGRDDGTMGAHAGGANQGTLGICVCAGTSAWSVAQWETLAALVADLVDRYNLGDIDDAVTLPNGDTAYVVSGHREVGTTTTLCPGMSGTALRSTLASYL